MSSKVLELFNYRVDLVNLMMLDNFLGEFLGNFSDVFLDHFLMIFGQFSGLWEISGCFGIGHVSKLFYLSELLDTYLRSCHLSHLNIFNFFSIFNHSLPENCGFPHIIK